MRVKLSLGGSLRLNRPLLWDVVNAQGTLLLRKGDIPTDQKQLEVLIEQGAYAHVSEADFERQKQQARQAAAPPEPPRFNPLSPWHAIQGRLATLLADPEGAPCFPDNLEAISVSILALAEKNNDMAIFAMVQLDQTRYAVSHALQTAVLCAVYCEASDWPMLERLTLVNAALTMNIAMLDLQQTLTQQVEPPTPEQRALIRSHPVRGRARLDSLGVMDKVWLRIVAEHHECADGKGYPAGIANILPSAELLNVADRYWAKMSRRRRRGALASDRAAGDLLLLSSGREQTIVAAMIEALGLYPPGTFVKLANGEIAVVVSRSEQAHKPMAFALLNPSGAEVAGPAPRDTSKPEFAISYVIPEQSITVRVDPGKLFGTERVQ